MHAEDATTVGAASPAGDAPARGSAGVPEHPRGGCPVSGDGVRVLVLATAGAAAVKRVMDAARSEHPDARLTLAVAGADRWRYPKHEVEHWVVGEHSIHLDRSVARHEVSSRGFGRVVVPVGIPRPGFGALSSFVLALRRVPVSVRLGGWLHIDARVPASFALMLLTVCLHWPLQLGLAFARWLDGVLLLALQVTALTLVRRRRSGSAGGNDTWCHVVTSLGTGGTQRQVLQVAAQQVARGRRVVVLALNREGGAFEGLDATAGVQVQTLHDRLRERGLLHALAYAFPHAMMVLALAARLRTLRPGVVWGWQFLANVVASTAARFARVPRVVTKVENLSAWKTWPEYRRWWYRAADRLAARTCDRVVANAQALVADYAAWAGVLPERMRIVPNGFDVQGFLALPSRAMRPLFGIGDDATVVLSLGRLAPEKNLPMLLRVWAALHSQDENHVLLIAGHGVQEPELRELARDLGIASHVVFAGQTTEPQSFYRAADVFVLTSRLEGMPNVLIEAQLFGVPAVTTAAGGAGEVVLDGETGFVVAIDDERAFGEALARLLGDPGLRGRMARHAAQRAQARFSVERSADAIDAVIDELARGEERA